MKVYINYDDRRWKKYKIDFKRIANRALGRKDKDTEVSIVLTNDSEIQKLNKEYRGFDKPTNVLSFEMCDPELLGDIYISFDTVMKEAIAENKTFEEHVAHMIVHGMLHLLGYDHLTDADANEMESLEIDILKSLKIGNPYIEGEPVTKKKSWFKQSVLYFLLGGISFLGFAPFNFWLATLVGVGGAYYLTVRNNDNYGTGRFWKSLLEILPFTASYAIGMFWWMLNSIFVVPELAAEFAVLTIPGIIGIGLVGGLIFAIPFVIIRCMHVNPAHRAILFAAIWTTVLWLREWLFTGFPWNPIANLSMPYPIISNSMSVWGAIGLTFIIIGLVASIVEIIRNKKQKNVFIPLVIFTVLFLIGGFFGYKNIKASQISESADAPVVRIVQPARSAVEKASYSREQAILNAEANIKRLIELATADESSVDVMVFPETSYPYLITENDSFPMATALGVKTIIGTTSYKAGNVYNSLLVANADGEIESLYSKFHLVPFGEYRPFGDILPTPGQLTPGDGPAILKTKVNDQEFNITPAVCYEIIFTDSLLPKKSDTIPSVIINLTNDTWFGHTPGTYQHLDMVRRYAIESGLPIIRANYSGISAFIGSDGKVLSYLPIGEAGTIDGTLGGAHVTVYREVGRDLWMAIVLLFSIICAVSIPVSRQKD